MDELTKKAHNLEGENSHLKAAAWRNQLEIKRANQKTREAEEERKALRRRLFESTERGEKEGRIARATQRSKEILTARNSELSRSVEEARLQIEEKALIVTDLEAKLVLETYSNGEYADENRRLREVIAELKHAYGDITRVAWVDNTLPPERPPHFHRCALCQRDRNCFCADEQEFNRTYVCTGNSGNPFKCWRPLTQWFQCAVPQCRQWFLTMDPEKIKYPSLGTVTCYRCRGVNPAARITAQEWARILARSGDAYYNPNLEANRITKLQAMTGKATKTNAILNSAIGKMEEAIERMTAHPRPAAPPPGF